MPNYHDYESIGIFLRDCRRFYSDKIKEQNKEATRYNREAKKKKIPLKRKKKNTFTQLEVGLSCGFDGSQHISNIERGEVLPSLSLATKLMKLYDIDREAMYTLFLKYREREYKRVFLEKQTI
ncbi:MAG: hypothetical protein MJK18_10740 [Bdellovibrionales bacterium]|nr:hypothetical protein [Bdellovibrionales bacterium]